MGSSLCRRKEELSLGQECRVACHDHGPLSEEEEGCHGSMDAFDEVVCMDFLEVEDEE